MRSRRHCGLRVQHVSAAHHRIAASGIASAAQFHQSVFCWCSRPYNSLDHRFCATALPFCATPRPVQFPSSADYTNGRGPESVWCSTSPRDIRSPHIPHPRTYPPMNKQASEHVLAWPSTLRAQFQRLFFCCIRRMHKAVFAAEVPAVRIVRSPKSVLSPRAVGFFGTQTRFMKRAVGVSTVAQSLLLGSGLLLCRAPHITLQRICS